MNYFNYCGLDSISLADASGSLSIAAFEYSICVLTQHLPKRAKCPTMEAHQKREEPI